MPYSDNDFPSAFNFPVPSFTQGVIPPDVDPDEGELLLVAYNPEWIPVLMAACNQLMQYSTWLGTDDEKKLAVNRAANLKILLQTGAELPTTEVPTPYWDGEENVDDELPEDEQDWYGETPDPEAPPGEITFIQNAVIWLFSGFVAVATIETGPGAVAAAVTFRTIAKRFIVAFNRGEWVEQFRIIIDAQDYVTVDTSDMEEGDIIEVDANDLPPDAEDHEIIIVVTRPE